MADKVVNNDIEFAYVSYNAETEIKKELEKYFLYQNILIIDKYFEFSETINAIKQNTKCNIIVERDVQNIKNFENISCIINVNDYNLNDVKIISFKNNIPYILVLTKICDSFCFKNCAYYGFDILNTNYPIGIIFALNQLVSLQRFVCSCALEISSVSFLELQYRICELFFTNYSSKLNLIQNRKILKELIKVLQNKQELNKKFVKDFVCLYISYALHMAKLEPNLLDNLLELYKIENNTYDVLEVKYAFILIITSLEKNFFKYYTLQFKNEINYEKHQIFLSSIGVKACFRILQMPDSKLNFLLSQFRSKLIDFVKTELNFQEILKNQLAEINVDYLFEIFSKFKSLNITNYLNIEQDIFKSKNFLTILYNQGLLNFDF